MIAYDKSKWRHLDLPFDRKRDLGFQSEMSIVSYNLRRESVSKENKIIQINNKAY